MTGTIFFAFSLLASMHNPPFGTGWIRHPKPNQIGGLCHFWIVRNFSYLIVDSYRLRFGARADWNITGQLGVYAGAAWEHEFDGKAQATAYGLDTPSPSVRGDTGVFDFGFSLKPSAVPGLTMELGATATAGVRHGIMGNMTVKYEF